ncbi:MAG: hypothetical protein IKX33_01390 [Prevotella sp.]|nr:hypothetical protein [Prevotella sp.]
MNKKLKYIGICLVIIIATAFVIGYISQIFVSKDNPPSEEKLKQNHDYIIISEQVFRYNKELPKSIGNGFNLVHVKYDADVNSLIFSIEGSDTITYEQLQKILPQIKSHTILKLQNALEMKSDPLIMSVVDAGASIRYIMTADTLNFEFEISPEELKSNPALGKEPLAIEYLKEY